MAEVMSRSGESDKPPPVVLGFADPTHFPGNFSCSNLYANDSEILIFPLGPYPELHPQMPVLYYGFHCKILVSQNPTRYFPHKPTVFLL